VRAGSQCGKLLGDAAFSRQVAERGEYVAIDMVF
jgi:hypothetical protein